MDETINEYPQLPPDEETPSWLARNRRFVILGGIVVIIGIGLIVLLQSRTGTATQQTDIVSNTIVTSNTSTQPSVFRRYTVPASNDQDKDGLTDAQEEEIGTNPAQVDTDGDGLSDYDEVKVYLTDPRKPDSDGDGIPDGIEVRQGTNPRGTGTLLNLNQAVQQLTNK